MVEVASFVSASRLLCVVFSLRCLLDNNSKLDNKLIRTHANQTLFYRQSTHTTIFTITARYDYGQSGLGTFTCSRYCARGARFSQLACYDFVQVTNPVWNYCKLDIRLEIGNQNHQTTSNRVYVQAQVFRIVIPWKTLSQCDIKAVS